MSSAAAGLFGELLVARKSLLEIRVDAQGGPEVGERPVYFADDPTGRRPVVQRPGVVWVQPKGLRESADRPLELALLEYDERDRSSRLGFSINYFSHIRSGLCPDSSP